MPTTEQPAIARWIEAQERLAQVERALIELTGEKCSIFDSIDILRERMKLQSVVNADWFQQVLLYLSAMRVINRVESPSRRTTLSRKAEVDVMKALQRAVNDESIVRKTLTTEVME